MKYFILGREFFAKSPNITWGSEYVFNLAANPYINSTLLDPTHFVVSYRDDGNSSYGTAIIGTISGSNITWGSKYVFNSAITSFISNTVLDATHFLVSYSGSSGYGTSIVGTVTGNSISFDPEIVWKNIAVGAIYTLALDSDHLVNFISGNDSSYATIGDFGGANRFVGIAQEAKLAGETVKVITQGSSNVHSGLTTGITYYADTAGNVTDTVSSYPLGMAISPTTILLKNTSADQYFGDMIFENDFRITEDYEDEQGLTFKNNKGQNILNLDENGKLKTSNVETENIKTSNVETTNLKLGSNQTICKEENYGSIKYENDNFYGCKSTGWLLLGN